VSPVASTRGRGATFAGHLLALAHERPTLNRRASGYQLMTWALANLLSARRVRLSD